jgi:methanogenic corrinoid protein MtbC1
MTAGGGISDIADVCFAPVDYAGPRRAVRTQDSRDPHIALKRLIEAEIGPKLVLFHSEAQPISPPENRPRREDVERLATLVIGTDEAATVAHFEKVCAQDHSYPTLLVHFIAPAAQLLGELWKEDVCTFFDVTIGLGRLQTLMDRLRAPEPAPHADCRRRVLLVALPGEAHVFGIRMVAKVLEATGWDVSVEEERPAEENARTAAGEWIGVVGLTLSAASRADLAARTVAAIRKASKNRSVRFMIGGAAINERPELALQVGGDVAVGLDAPTAAVVASHLLMRQTPMRR